MAMKDIDVKDVMTSLAVQESVESLRANARDGEDLRIWNFVALSAYSEEISLMSGAEFDSDEILAHIIVGKP